MTDEVRSEQEFWDRFARYDPLWAILSDPSKTERRWNLRDFLETGRREVSLLLYQLRALGIDVRREAALDFGCGVGRLSQPLASHFDRVVGIDISPEMIRLANEINQCPEQVHYVCNARDDLAVLGTGEFTFIYSNVVLQHVTPPRALQCVKELLRVAAPAGILVFQLPSHLVPREEQRPVSAAMNEQAYRASVRIENDVPQIVAPGAGVVLRISVTNKSGHAWRQSEVGSIRLGNHWLSGSGRVMLIQDDGRAVLPENLESGETCSVTITITAPPEPGEFQLECDVVHEGISWFADRGSATWRTSVVVAGVAGNAPPGEAADPLVGDVALSLPDMSSVESPGPLPMHGVHRDVVTKVVEEHGGTVVHLEVDERCGKEWIGYRYFVGKSVT
jgi:2-polyprenyl-3-methyl-5-hydroxy-6-metoxy-1,4-benzoquinol methylase